MNFTKWFKLRKPEQEEFYDVDDFNFNADILDTELKNVKDNYLPLTGGTVTGDVAINGALTVPNGLIRTNDTSKVMTIKCTADDKSGAKLLLGGKDATNNAGEFVITATNGTNSFNFWGLPTGKLTWGNKNIVRSVNSVNADDNGNVIITSVDHATTADSATSATSASQNASGHLLADTIVKSISIDGRTITVTKIDGKSYTLTTQDTTTVYTKLSQFVNDMGYITTDGRAYPREASGGNLNFHWSGKGGQPTWLWGGEDGSNMYVYNPANFSVNTANEATNAYNLRATSHSDHFVRSEWDNSYFWTWVRAPDGGYRGIRVERANSASYADSAGTVSWTGVSGRPTLVSQFTNDSGYITSAGSCNYANSAGYAGSAGSVAWGNISGIPNLVSVASSYNATSGYCKFSDGTILQYHKLPNGTTGSQTVTWAIPFSDTNYIAIGGAYVEVRGLSTTYCQVDVTASGYLYNLWVFAYGK